MTERRGREVVALGVAAGFLVLFLAGPAGAIPSWARKYKTSCTTCHYAFPKLNKFGKAFENNGFRFPGDDEAYTKEEPTELGSEGQKRAFPDAIWPADIAGTPPLSVRLLSRVHIRPDREKDPALPKIEFEMPHEFELLMGGTIGESFSYSGEMEIENEDELEYEFFLQYDAAPQFHIKMGNVDPTPIRHMLRLTREAYNYGDNRISPEWRFRDGQAGVEFWGAGDGPNKKGGYKYAVGIVNGQGRTDVNDKKDVYGRVAWKFGGLAQVSAEEAGRETQNFWLDNSVTVGGFGYFGQTGLDGFENDFRVAGGNVDLLYRNLNLFGAALRQRDDNPKGNVVENNLTAWFAEADYVFWPWLIGVGRYEWTEKAEETDAITSFIPGVVVMGRANVRFTLEGKFRLDKAGEEKDRITGQVDFAF